MKTRIIDVKNGHPLAEYWKNITHCAKNLCNTTNFYIRNTLTGLSKSPEERTHNEIEVLHEVFTGLQKINEPHWRQFETEAQRASRLEASELEKRAVIYQAIIILKKHLLPYPDHGKRMLSYRQLDAVFKANRNPCYYALPAQVNQQAIRKVCFNWNSFYKARKDWTKHPSKYVKKPRIPGYIREAQTTASFTNQVCKPSVAAGKLMLSFPASGLKLCAGKGVTPQDYIRTEVSPHPNGYRVCVTYKDDVTLPIIPKSPSRILGLDMGLRNFLAGAFNFEATPFLIKGNWLKELNQWFNKERSRLLSELTKGTIVREKPSSRRLESLTILREHRMRDFFYKTAHWLCRKCLELNVEVIVVGHNTGQKQNICLGNATNQNFVPIPFTEFLNILTNVAADYHIPVVIREESYTSKASLLDLDKIPIYKEEGAEKTIFSGKRCETGLYQSKDGTFLNADINGAGNILRKEYPYAFEKLNDRSFLWKSVKVIDRAYLCGVTTVRPDKHKKRHLPAGHRLRHQEHKHRKYEYMEVFHAKVKKVIPLQGVEGA